MEVLMQLRYEFDIDGADRSDLGHRAECKAKDFFGPVPFALDVCVIEAPNLKNWYQAKVTAREKRPDAPNIRTGPK
jgi:hypothetical protein